MLSPIASVAVACCSGCFPSLLCLKPQLYRSRTFLCEAVVGAGGSAWDPAGCHILVPRSLCSVETDAGVRGVGCWWRGTDQREQTGCGQRFASDGRVSAKQRVTWEDASVQGNVKASWKSWKEMQSEFETERESERKTERKNKMYRFVFNDNDIKLRTPQHILKDAVQDK